MGNIDFPIQITNIKVLKQNENDKVPSVFCISGYKLCLALF